MNKTSSTNYRMFAIDPANQKMYQANPKRLVDELKGNGRYEVIVQNRKSGDLFVGQSWSKGSLPSNDEFRFYGYDVLHREKAPTALAIMKAAAGLGMPVWFGSMIFGPGMGIHPEVCVLAGGIPFLSGLLISQGTSAGGKSEDRLPSLGYEISQGQIP